MYIDSIFLISISFIIGPNYTVIPAIKSLEVSEGIENPCVLFLL
jgi:hypothetical protein